MQRFRAASFSAAFASIAQTMTTIDGAEVIFGAEADHAQARAATRHSLNNFEQAVDELGLSRVLSEQFRRIVARVDDATSTELSLLLREFLNNLSVELSAHYFLMIREDRRGLFEQKSPPFGLIVSSRFPEANRDIESASRCFALDEWTASVFHSMRVLEHGLRTLAKDLNLGSDVIAQENWKNVIDQVERKIREMEQLPKSPAKAERLRKLSAMASEFRYFKDAWRNHVSHAHATYDEREAHKVFDHVKSFMGQLAEAVSQT